MCQTRRVPPAAPPNGRVRILIAADDRRLSERLRASAEAHETLEVVGIAEDGSEAIRLFEELKPSLVLMDVALPDLGGIEAARRLRERSDSPAVVLMLSDEDARDFETSGVGAAAYMRKTGDLDSMLDIVVAFATQKSS